MSLVNAKMSLSDIQNNLIAQLSHTCVISDLPLSEEEYRYLATKIKKLFRFSNDNNVVDDYKLSIVVYWVFSMIYWDKNHLGQLEMDVLFEGIPQYKKKYYLDVCMEAFDEYGLYKYQVNYEDIFYLARAVIARHAGIPDDEQDDAFEVISRFLDSNLVAEMVEAIMMDLPAKTKTIFCCFDDMTKQKVILDLRNLMIICFKGEKSKEELEKQYPYISHKIIDVMRHWCNRRQEYISLEFL